MRRVAIALPQMKQNNWVINFWGILKIWRSVTISLICSIIECDVILGELTPQRSAKLWENAFHCEKNCAAWMMWEWEYTLFHIEKAFFHNLAFLHPPKVDSYIIFSRKDLKQNVILYLGIPLPFSNHICIVNKERAQVICMFICRLAPSLKSSQGSTESCASSETGKWLRHA